MEKAKRLKEIEMRSINKQLLEIGRLAMAAKIDKLDKESLLGAFLEIAEKSQSGSASLDLWKKKSQALKTQTSDRVGQALVISFETSPPIEIKAVLKEHKFKWNDFRGEYYGFGDKTKISNLLKSCKCAIESV